MAEIFFPSRVTMLATTDSEKVKELTSMAPKSDDVKRFPPLCETPTP